MRFRERESRAPADVEADMPCASEGVLLYGNRRVLVCGRALKLIVWMAAHQTRINAMAPAAGQLWLTWKGDGEHSLSGDLKTAL
jgi:hypothetical protein